MQPSNPFTPSVRAQVQRRLRPVAVVLTATWLMAGCGALSPQKPTTTPSTPVTVVVAVPVKVPSPSETPPAAPEPQPVADPVRQVLAQTDGILRLAPSDLPKEIARLGESEEAAVETPLLLATALAQTRQAVDTARALGLVQRLLANNAPAAQPLHPLARLMEARLLQQRRLEDQMERQAQQLRDAQRRNDQLNERLEAVRAIERSLTTRPAAVPAAPASVPGSAPQRPTP